MHGGSQSKNQKDMLASDWKYRRGRKASNGSTGRSQDDVSQIETMSHFEAPGCLQVSHLYFTENAAEEATRWPACTASAGQALHFGGTDADQPENNEEILHPDQGRIE